MTKLLGGCWEGKSLVVLEVEGQCDSGPENKASIRSVTVTGSTKGAQHSVPRGTYT